MKKILKLITAATLVSTLVFGMVGCKTKDEPKTDEANKKVGIVVSTLNNPFFVQMKEGAEEKAKDLGYELVVLDSQNDPAKERSNVEDLVQQGVAAIVINPTDSDAVENAIKVANEAKIPVITVDRAANGGEVVSHIASDNVAGGELAAEYILEQLGDTADIKLVELQGIPGASATNDRGAGFHNIVDDKEGITVVSSQAADFDRQKGLTVTENIIQAQPEFHAIFAHNDEMALGAVKALKASNRNVIVVGFDGNDDAIDAVNAGEMAATVAQQPKLMGEIAIMNAVKTSTGETVDAQIPVDLALIKK
ncbi:ribose ABC transporter substrate-binding protein RbsB [Clostridium sediminicola]|uniref:ribose ABC transporter substrate-binding protein RbsB n=1 Tax=Clostridium sediminicola TaxID=3114879 RepID=UPI0031F1DB9F